jgi:uncharacterized DUF497 family protein
LEDDVAARVECVWDLDDDPDGNIRHIAEHDITVEEAEEVVRSRHQEAVASRSSGRPTVFGWTSTGKHLAVMYEVVDKDIPQVYVVTAFEAPPPAEPKQRRKRR